MLIILFSALTFKHFLADFILQRSYQFRNKGKYGHPGGLLHAGIHGVGTLLSLLYFVPLEMAFSLAVLDMVVHYHIDWAKSRVNSKMKLDPNEDNEYWFLFGFDQFLHHMTYIGIVLLVQELAPFAAS